MSLCVSARRAASVWGEKRKQKEMSILVKENNIFIGLPPEKGYEKVEEGRYIKMKSCISVKL